MATPIRVFTKRPTPLKDQNVVYITNYTSPFDVELWQQIGTDPPTLLHKQDFNPTQVPQPPEPPVTEAVLIYDSNIHGKWNNGVRRLVKKAGDGNIGANGLGIYPAASGSPEIEIMGDGIAILRTDGGDDGESHGRFYTAVCNYNGIFETDFNMMSETITSYTQKFRCRHQASNWAGEDVACEDRFGGIGNGYDKSSVSLKTEKCHNIHDGDDAISEKLSKKLDYGKWYKSRFTYKDTDDKKGIYQKSELDYGSGFVTVAEGVHEHPLPFYMDKDKFMQRSEIWNRINGFGELHVRNQKLYALP